MPHVAENGKHCWRLDGAQQGAAFAVDVETGEVRRFVVMNHPEQLRVPQICCKCGIKRALTFKLVADEDACDGFKVVETTEKDKPCPTVEAAPAPVQA